MTRPSLLILGLTFCACTDPPVETKECPAGFAGDGVTCLNVGECAAGLADCAPEAFCEDTNGGYTCTCRPGFAGDGRTCTNVDECASGAATCDANATCTDDPGTYHCACKEGFTGDGKTCTAIDRCAAGLVTCGAHEQCEHDACVCVRGFERDGTTCVDVTQQIRWVVPDSSTSYCSDGANSISNPIPGSPLEGQDCTVFVNPPKYETTPDVVRDLVTGLEWQRITTDANYTWEEAMATCAALVLGGHDDWRVPSVVELHSIVDLGRGYACLDPIAFPSAVEAFHWTSTPVMAEGQEGRHWFVSMRYGHSSYGFQDPMHLRCVR